MLTVRLSDGKGEHHEAACCEGRGPFTEGPQSRRYGGYKAGGARRRRLAHGGKRRGQHVRDMLRDDGVSSDPCLMLRPVRILCLSQARQRRSAVPGPTGYTASLVSAEQEN